MRTTEIMREINQLPIPKRIRIAELTIKSIRESETKNGMQKAADSLYVDYSTDSELTAFTSIDFEKFYETR